MKLDIFDSLFENSISMAGEKQDFKPTYFEWNRNPKQPTSPLFFTESHLDQVGYYCNEFDCYAILVEPEELHPENYQRALELEHRFDGIFTHDALYAKREKWYWYPFGGSWIVNPEITQKTRDVGIIASHKESMPGHKLRHKVICHLGKYFEPHAWGSGYMKFDTKSQVLSQYRFMVVIENSRRDYWFTEKLLDAMSMGCIPIYWGCPDISRFFDPDGILQFDDYAHLVKLLDVINFEEEYDLRYEAMERNFEIAKHYFICEDVLHANYPKVFSKDVQ